MDEKLRKINNVGTYINQCLIVTVEDELSDDAFETFCNSILSNLEHKGLGATVLDFSKVTMLDPFAFKRLSNLTKAMQLMGTAVVWSQLSPGVVSCMMDFSMDTNGINFSSTVEAGLKMIESLT